MTTQTLEQYEAQPELLEEMQARDQGRSEAFADVEDTIVETLDEIVGTVGAWVSELHVRFSELEAKVEASLRLWSADDIPDVDFLDLAQVESELDTAMTVGDHLGRAVNALSQALFHLGERTGDDGAAVTGADDNVEHAYWSLMKAKADVAEWESDIQAKREAMLS